MSTQCHPPMKTKIKSLIAVVMLSGVSITIPFALANTHPNQNGQTEAEVTVPSVLSTTGGNGGMQTRADTLLPSVRYGAHIDLNQASVTLDRLDIRSVPAIAPNQIGVNRGVAVSATTRAQKFVNLDGSQIIVFIIKSSGAFGIGVHFRNFALARGEEVYVYGTAADSVVCGAYVNKGPWGSGEFWSGTLVGDTAIVEFYTASKQAGAGFEIFEVSHIFPEFGSQLQPAAPDVTPLPCEVDASCSADPQKNAVGRISYNNNGTFVCTGTLLNDRPQDSIPYFLTANHCVSTQTVAQTVEVWWFYQTTSCDSRVLRPDIVHQTGGANLLVTQSSNDFSLLRLVNNAPAGALFSGWSPTAKPTNTAVFGLHHPGMYFPPAVDSYLRKATGTIASTTNINCTPSGLIDGYLTTWTAGTAERGSSGSGLFSSNGLVGVLSCGPDTEPCIRPFGVYSKFANFFSQIQRYLDPHPSFFAGEVWLGNGVYYLRFPGGTPFGYYSYLADPHVIYHDDMGYEYWFDANNGQGGIFFYDFASGHFFYTSPSFGFPYLYDFSLNAVLYYFPDQQRPEHYTTNPRYFFNYATGRIITM